MPKVDNADLSIVIPVFNNEGSLRDLVTEILVLFEDSDAVNFEILFVNDGSNDKSLEVIQDLANSYPDIVYYYNLTRNFGQLAAMIAGYEHARGAAIVSISADRQDPTELILELYKNFLNGHEVVIAHRAARSDGFFAKFTSRIAYRIARKSYPALPKGGFDFFLMSSRVNEHLTDFEGRFRFLQGDLMWLGFPTALVPYERRARQIGKSGYTLRKRIANFYDLLIDSSPGPIKLVSRLGLFVTVAAVLYGVTVVIEWGRGRDPFTGWAPLMLVILVMNGTILLMLGLIGEYLWRLNDAQRKRPTYVIQQHNRGSLPEK